MGGPAQIDGQTHDEVDNFLPVNFIIDGKTYYSAENYFQCAKCADPVEREKVRNSGTGDDVWEAGSRVRLRPDWEKVKVREMYNGNKAKLEQNPTLAQKLTSSHGSVLFTEGSSFWCKWNGLICELLREELKPEGSRNDTVIKTIWAQITEYEASH